MERFNNLIEFRQATYEHGFTKASDAQFELVDALLFGRPIRSFPELSLLPTFRRQWHSSYAAIERGGQDWEWLEGFFIQQNHRRIRRPFRKKRKKPSSQGGPLHTTYSGFQRTMRYILWSGAPGGTRTHNLLIRSQSLSPVELQAHDFAV